MIYSVKCIKRFFEPKTDKIEQKVGNCKTKVINFVLRRKRKVITKQKVIIDGSLIQTNKPFEENKSFT